MALQKLKSEDVAVGLMGRMVVVVDVYMGFEWRDGITQKSLFGGIARAGGGEPPTPQSSGNRKTL